MKVMPLVYVILLFIALCSTANAESLPVAMPDNLNWSYQPMNVYLNFNPSNLTDTSFTASLNISNYKVIGSNKTYYVNVNTGSDTNNGLTPGAALGTIAAAVAKSDVDIIVLAPGTYTRDPTSNGLGNVVQLNITRNVSIVCPDGRAKVSLRNAFATWTQNGTYTNVYEVSRSGIYRVFDSSKLDGYGDYTELKHVNSVAEVNTNVSSWYNDGVKTYVRTIVTWARIYPGSSIVSTYTINFNPITTFTCCS